MCASVCVCVCVCVCVRVCVCMCVRMYAKSRRDTYNKLGLTLQCMEEIVDCVLVERQGFFVLLFVVCLGGLLDQLDGFLSVTMLYCLNPFSALASL